MKLQGKVCVVTGGAHGIGRALCERFVAEGAAAVVVSDRDGDAAREVASRLRGLAPKAAAGVAQAVVTDVSQEREIAALVQATLAAHGRIDLFVSNAGIAVGGGAEAPDADWQRAWDVNVMAHVWGARHVLPSMLARGEGYLLATASAAGLLTSLGAAPYAATKHAAVAFAEWLSITHRDAGIKVSCLCPQGVKTNLLTDAAKDLAGRAVIASGPLLSPEQVAEATVRGLEAERFLILPHPEVAEYVKHRALDQERWLAGMRSFLRKLKA